MRFATNEKPRDSNCNALMGKNMMKKIRLFLWNVCDHACGNSMIKFRVCAVLLHVLGCNYWTNSIDFRGQQ